MIALMEPYTDSRPFERKEESEGFETTDEGGMRHRGAALVVVASGRQACPSRGDLAVGGVISGWIRKCCGHEFTRVC